ncbi:hypothetical protein ASD11_10275 [Aeromicrobium sp. Root495]|uniref:serine/threonine-protein kinase n=1 Tax=Aeromicrobium sp. Root495 TaxID=1736550 RepID=UPI0006F5317F|nr:serine/threonine-protein kinase [Aeromicrobium sp. Root495]KQY59894.1 hypothetical protein ASD11_10275 [Aeromicrobium sp. Root495]
MIDDRYELVRKIGRGGTGDVWLGHDHVLGRDVALKQLGLTPGTDRPDTARAEREARLSASVRHPSVVAVYDVADDEDGREWLVMELVEGRSLAELVRESGPVPEHRLTPLVRNIVDGLAAAHTAGIVHRDVKPSNVLLTPQGMPKLTDFGVARTISDTALTSTGIVTGSPGYLAPEVAEGSSATHASDVWSLGATVFHAATGERPFGGDDPLAMLERIVDEAPPQLPDGHPLAWLVAACLRREPGQRPTAATLAGRLAALEDDADQATGPIAVVPAAPEAPMDLPEPTRAIPARAAREAPTSPERRTFLRGVAAAVAVVAVLGTAFALNRGGGDEPETTASQTQDPGPSSAEASPSSAAASLESFATDYLDTAGNNPERGYALLTPAYQRASGGLEGYRAFWGKVSNVRVTSITPHPDRMDVTYVYSYTYQGKNRTEEVTLTLEPEGDSYRIAGASAVAA